MKVKLKSLVRRVKPEPQPVSEKAPKARDLIPEITLNTKMKGMAGLKDYRTGHKCKLIFEATVKGDRSPERWELEHEGLEKTDRVVTFELRNGALEAEPKTIAEATDRMKKSGEKY